MRTLSIGGILLAFLPTIALACTCFYQGEFIEYSRSHPIVIKGRVAFHGQQLRNRENTFTSMLIEVSEVIKGSLDERTVELEGDRGMSCLQYITAEQFPIDSEHLFLLSSAQPVQGLGVCGETSVRVNNGIVEGMSRTSQGMQSYELPLEDVIERITTQHDNSNSQQASLD